MFPKKKYDLISDMYTRVTTPIPIMQLPSSNTCEGKYIVEVYGKTSARRIALTKSFKSQFD